MPGRRMALAALSALAAAAAFTAPATATSFDSAISVQPYAQIGEDGTITLSGTYRCTDASPVGGIQIAASVIQDHTRLTTGAGGAVCDGAEHEWESRASLRYTPDIHPGPARAEVRLQEVKLSGLMPKSLHTLAEDQQDIQITG
ncbi:DUF6299 family protein [Streptomyces sp. NPDC006326]|uniref:DUF6299 family protein n=1 Tax=Streptomyces sp. NPDC006326 TaxID=3156752 RepID=UPI0033B56E13